MDCSAGACVHCGVMSERETAVLPNLRCWSMQLHERWACVDNVHVSKPARRHRPSIALPVVAAARNKIHFPASPLPVINSQPDPVPLSVATLLHCVPKK